VNKKGGLLSKRSILVPYEEVASICWEYGKEDPQAFPPTLPKRRQAEKWIEMEDDTDEAVFLLKHMGGSSYEKALDIYLERGAEDYWEEIMFLGQEIKTVQNITHVQRMTIEKKIKEKMIA
jgi:hypothetical protein